MKTPVAIFASIFCLALVAPSLAFAQDEEQEPTPEPAPEVEEQEVPRPRVEAAYEEDTREPAAEVTAQAAGPAAPPVIASKRFLHGFRLGYVYFKNFDKSINGEPDGQTWKDKYGIKSPNMFLLGYEVTRRMVSHDWLNVVLVGNASVTGLEQSLFLVSASGIIGFEFNEKFQVGVGVNLAPTREKPAHMVMAAGFMPKVGTMSVPIHVIYIPDVDGADRFAATVGVNW